MGFTRSPNAASCRGTSPSLRSTWQRHSPAALGGLLDLLPSSSGIPKQPPGEPRSLGSGEVPDRRPKSTRSAPPGRQGEGKRRSCSPGLSPRSWAPCDITTPLPGPLRYQARLPCRCQPRALRSRFLYPLRATSGRWRWSRSETRRRLGWSAQCRRGGRSPGRRAPRGWEPAAPGPQAEVPTPHPPRARRLQSPVGVTAGLPYLRSVLADRRCSPQETPEREFCEVGGGGLAFWHPGWGGRRSGGTAPPPPAPSGRDAPPRGHLRANQTAVRNCAPEIRLLGVWFPRCPLP